MKYSQRVAAVNASYIQNGQWLKVNFHIKTWKYFILYFSKDIATSYFNDTNINYGISYL